MWIQERSPTPAVSPKPSVEARLRWWVERLAIPRHIVADARNNRWVRDQLVAAFRNLGFCVRLQGRYGNVLALPRTAGGEPLTLVAAHYDSVPGCPGADDNASGLAVMLECAGALASTGARVGFIAFNAEEENLAGSRDFVAHGLGNLGNPVAQVHVLEMVGYHGAGRPAEPLPVPWTPPSARVPDFIGVLGRGASNDVAHLAARSPAAPGLHVLAVKTWGPLHRWFPDLARSDHFPFWSAGLPAVLWTDTGNFRNPNYHRPSDTPDTLDYGFMSEVAELLCAVVSDGLTIP